MTTAASFAAMSDPTRNRQFRRAWTDPPDKRKRRPARGGVSNKIGTQNTVQIIRPIVSVNRFEALMQAAASAWLAGRRHG